MNPAVFGYIRVSQAEGASGLATQSRILSEHGLRDDRVFTDVASGRTMRRPAWQRLREKLQPGDAPFTIDLDSTVCDTYGLAKEGARHHGYTGKRGYHPLLAIAAGTGDVLMARLREGRANTARGAAHFLRETVSRVRHAGARGQLTVRADSGFYTHSVVSVCRKMNVRFSITIRQHQSLRNLIEAIKVDPISWTVLEQC